MEQWSSNCLLGVILSLPAEETLHIAEDFGAHGRLCSWFTNDTSSGALQSLQRAFVAMCCFGPDVFQGCSSIITDVLSEEGLTSFQRSLVSPRMQLENAELA